MAANTILVQPERKVSEANLYGMLQRYKSKKSRRKEIVLLESTLDIDYLGGIYENDDVRVFMADFLLEYMAVSSAHFDKEAKRAQHRRQRDIFNNFSRSCIDVDKSGETAEDFVTLAIKSNTPAATSKYDQPSAKQNYTLRDYTPSLRFNPDAIIDYIDNQNAKMRERNDKKTKIR
jgi:hypothetical protein